MKFRRAAQIKLIKWIEDVSSSLNSSAAIARGALQMSIQDKMRAYIFCKCLI